MKYTTTLLALTSSAFAVEGLELNPNAHLNLAFGQASTDEATLAAHGHDPQDEFSTQGLELNLSAKYNEHLAAFIAYNTFFEEPSNSLDGELEEAFIKLHQLPGGFELRGGRLLNRVTSQNSQHLHSWHFTDANLITSRFLGDEGLITESLELSYRLPFQHDSFLSLAIGDAIPDEGHGEEEGAPDPDHVEGEEALLNDDILSIRLKGSYFHNDFNQFTYGLSFLTGHNSYSERSNIYGADLTYMWKENGLEKGGQYLRATLEPIYRDFDFVSEDGSASGSASEWGLHSSVGWGFREHWELGIRFDYLEGVGEPVEELPERHRYSLALTRQYTYNEYVQGHVRLQYNHDSSDSFGSEDSIWLQLQLDLGKGEEVR